MSQLDSTGPRAAGQETALLSALAAVGFVAVMFAAAFADYVSSWLPPIASYAAGGMLRDGLCILFVGLAAVALVQANVSRSRVQDALRRPTAAALAAALPFVAFAAWVLLLVAASASKSIAAQSTRNLLLYTTVGFAAWVLTTRGHLSARTLLGTLAALGTVLAILGILDTLTHGGIVQALGYRRDYAGVPGAADRIIAGPQSAFQGYVRASGGISNALVFGYLMATIGVFSAWALERSVTGRTWRDPVSLLFFVVSVLVGVACIASLTRGAMAALFAGLLVLIVVRHSRTMVLAAVGTAALAVVLTWAGSNLLSTSGPSLVDAATARAQSSDNVSQESTAMRVDELRQGVASLRSRPMGNGLGSEGASAERAGTASADLAPDVYVLIVALQTGIIGAVLYAVIFLAMLAWAVRRRAHGRTLVLAMIAVFAFAATLSASPDAPVFALTIWVLMLAVSVVPDAGPSRTASLAPAT